MRADAAFPRNRRAVKHAVMEALACARRPTRTREGVNPCGPVVADTAVVETRGRDSSSRAAGKRNSTTKLTTICGDCKVSLRALPRLLRRHRLPTHSPHKRHRRYQA